RAVPAPVVQAVVAADPPATGGGCDRTHRLAFEALHLPPTASIALALEQAGVGAQEHVPVPAHDRAHAAGRPQAAGFDGAGADRRRQRAGVVETRGIGAEPE